jgi:hypothetical protein
MNLVLDIDKIYINNIFFNESVKNTVMDNSGFTRIMYSNEHFVLNGIHIKIELYKNMVTKQLHNVLSPSMIINYIDNIEKDILNKYNTEKLQSNKLKDQLIYNLQKIHNSNGNNTVFNYLLKISGIWETDNIIGLTYKFVYLQNN